MSGLADLRLILPSEEEQWRRFNADALPRIGVVDSAADVSIALGHRLRAALPDDDWDWEPPSKVIPSPIDQQPEAYTGVNNMRLQREHDDELWQQRESDIRRELRTLGRDLRGVIVAVILVIGFDWLLMLSQGH